MMLLQYAASKGICEITNQATRDQMVQTALERFASRQVEMDDDGMFVCRILVKTEPGEMRPDDNPVLAVFILRKGADGGPDMNLLLWSEAQERGIADALLKLIDHSHYTPGPGKEMFPNKIPKGEVY
jgi:hypothetical protein